MLGGQVELEGNNKFMYYIWTGYMHNVQYMCGSSVPLTKVTVRDTLRVKMVIGYFFAPCDGVMHRVIGYRSGLLEFRSTFVFILAVY